MSEGYFKRVAQYTPTRMWINNPTLSETNKAIAAGAEVFTPWFLCIWKHLEEGKHEENAR